MAINLREMTGGDYSSGLARSAMPDNYNLSNMIDTSTLASPDSGGMSIADYLKSQQNKPMDNWEKFGVGANAIIGGLGALSARDANKMKKRQLDFEMSLARTNLANTANVQNFNMRNQADMAAQLSGGGEQGSVGQQRLYNELYTPVSGSLAGSDPRVVGV